MALATSALDVSEEARVTDTAGAETGPRVGVDPDGNLHVLYLVEDEGTDLSLDYRKVSPTGATLAGPVLLWEGDAATFYGHDLAVDAGGRVHVVFSAECAEEYWADVTYLRLDRDGTIALQPRKVHTSPHHSFYPRVDADVSGNVYVAFLDMGVGQVCWLRLDTVGEVAGGPLVVSLPGGSTSTDLPGLAAGGEGTSHVVWYQKEGRFEPWAIMHAVVSPQGDLSVGPAPLHSEPLMTPDHLNVDADGAGNLHLVDLVADPVVPDTVGVHYTQVDADGNVVVPWTAVEDGLRTWCDWCDVEAGPAGGAYVVYTRAKGFPASFDQMVLRVLDGDTGTFGETVTLSNAHCSYLAIASRDGETFAVAYSRETDLWVLTLGEVPVNAPPVAHLSCSPADPHVGQTVTFDGSGSSDPDVNDQVAEYRFDWGDGGTSGWTSDTTATHAYPATGTYIATLRVRDSRGLECEEAATVTVEVLDGPTNLPPVAALEVRPATTSTSGSVTLDGSGSHDPDGRVVAYLFSFGDGGSTGWTTSANALHRYACEGTYEASLQVRDDGGTSSETLARVTVRVEDPNVPPTATILEIAPDPATEGAEVTLRGVGRDDDGTVELYRWTSDRDGHLSSEAEFTTTGLSVGRHTIVLEVQDDEGAWSEPATATLEVRTNAPPTLRVLTAPGGCLAGEDVRLVVRYTDPDGDAPTMAQVHYGPSGDQAVADLEPVDPGDTDCRDGKEYQLVVRFDEPGDAVFHFVFENGANGRVTSEVTQLHVQGPAPEEAGEGVWWPVLLVIAVATVAAMAAKGRSRDRVRG